MTSIKKADKNKVYATYEHIFDWIRLHRDTSLQMERPYLDFLIEHTPKHGRVLDVGCGTGVPIAQYFIDQGYTLVGVDASKKMITYCQQNLPAGHWIMADMRQLNLDTCFDIVIAWHSFSHLPHDDQRSTLKKLAKHVKHEGFLAFTSGPRYGEVWSDNGGYLLYHASLSTKEYEQILKESGFTVRVHRVEDPDCGNATVWVAQKT